MTTALILMMSGILIGAGISVIWRDLRRKRRRAFVSERDVPLRVDPEIEITISRSGEAAAPPVHPLPQGTLSEPQPAPRVHPLPQATLSEAQLAPQPAPIRPVAINADTRNGARLSLEQRWSSSGVQRV